MAARSVFALAGLGLRAGYEPTLERIGPGDTPSDLVLRSGNVELCVEAKALRRPDESLEITAWLDGLTRLLMSSLASFNVEITGRALEPLDPDATRELAERLDTAARLIAAGGITPPIRAGRNDFEIPPAGADGPRTRISSPPTDLWRRTASRIRQAIEQAQTSGANWVVIESLDGMWQLTPWASMPLADRALQLAQAAEALIPDNTSIRGIVFTDGAATQDLATEDLSVQPHPRARALIRRINYTCSRQTVIIARHADEPHVEAWGELLDAEAGWTRWAVDRLDLPLAPELELRHPVARRKS
jgi:hypothetical protein